MAWCEICNIRVTGEEMFAHSNCGERKAHEIVDGGLAFQGDPIGDPGEDVIVMREMTRLDDGYSWSPDKAEVREALCRAFRAGRAIGREEAKRDER